MKKSNTKYIHVRLEADLEQALAAISEERGLLTSIMNAELRHWYLSNKDQIRLRHRIRSIAKRMDGHFYELEGVKIPHSVFVEWDQTWTVAEDLHITAMSSDAEIEAAILDWEESHDDYYSEEINEFVNKSLQSVT